MILKLERPLVFLDLETTGLDPENDRIIEIGLVKLTPDGDRQSLCERVDPGIDIPDQSTKVHGIRTEDVRGLFGKPPLSRIAGELLDFMKNSDLAGFNCLRFDVRLWEKECRRHAVDYHGYSRCVVDAKLIFNNKETGWDRFLMGPRNLTAAVRHYCGRDLDGAHAADVDAAASLDVLLAQLERYPDLPKDVQGLHEYCQRLFEQEEERRAQQQEQRRFAAG